MWYMVALAGFKVLALRGLRLVHASLLAAQFVAVNVPKYACVLLVTKRCPIRVIGAR
jgi:hypothetical protein